MAVQTIDGRAMTQLRAGNSTGTARVLASAPGLRGDRVQFLLGGLGTFPAGLAAVDADSGVARSVVTAAEPGTLRVQARVGDAIGQLDIPVINTQPPYLTLSANRLSMPADGSTSLQLTATPYATPAANSSSKTTRRQCVSRWCRGTPCSMPTKS